MPFPTTRDLFAYDLLQVSPRGLRDALDSMHCVNLNLFSPSDAARELELYPEPRTPMTLTAILLRAYYDQRERQHQYQFDKLAPPVDLSHPVFDELWELRGEDGTAKEMRQLMMGGEAARAFRVRCAKRPMGTRMGLENGFQ